MTLKFLQKLENGKSSLADLNAAEKTVVEIIVNVGYLLKLFMKDMEAGMNSQNSYKPPSQPPLQPQQPLQVEEPVIVEAPQLEDYDVQDRPMEEEEDKDELESFPEIFDSNYGNDKKNGSKGDKDVLMQDQFMADNEPLNPPVEAVESEQIPGEHMVKSNDTAHLNEDQVEPEINKTVDKIADDVINLTRKLHEVVDNLNSRSIIHQQISSDSISTKIGPNEMKDILSHLI